MYRPSKAGVADVKRRTAVPWASSILVAICLAPSVVDCSSFSQSANSQQLGLQSTDALPSLAAVTPLAHASVGPEKHDNKGGVPGLATAAIGLKTRRRVRVVIYARYSSEEQDASSIDDQVKYCREVLATMGITDADVTVLFDKEMSGELRNRPGVDVIWAGVGKPAWDLLICEDVSRLFRNETAALELIETAVDAGMRCLCVNDGVDTDQDDWEDRLRDAARHHSKANYYLRMRIRRRVRALWEMGAAITALRPGYMRTPTTAATQREPERGPFYDSVDPQWGPVLLEGYERTANGAPAWQMAEWATAKKIPKYGNSTSETWSSQEWINLIRRPVHRGVDRHRVKVVAKKRRTGKKRSVWNHDDVWTREMPHLRIVPDPLWYRANQAIDESRKRKDTPRGSDHPLYGTTRDSHGPLAELFLCERCKHKMYQEGRSVGAYRCGNIKRGRYRNECICWNKATALRDVTHENIGAAISSQLLERMEAIGPLVEYIRKLYQSDDEHARMEADLNGKIRSYEQQVARLVRLAKSVDEAPATLVSELSELESKLTGAKMSLVELQENAKEQKPELTEGRIRQAIQQACEQLMSMGRDMAPILQRIIPGKILAVPHLQFCTNHVVLRAQFELHLVKLLPRELQRALEGAPLTEFAWMEPIPMMVDLFAENAVVANAMKAYALYSKGKITLAELGDKLGMTRRCAHLSKELGKKMHAAGLTDPYIRLTAPPARSSHWRTSRKTTVEVPNAS